MRWRGRQHTWQRQSKCQLQGCLGKWPNKAWGDHGQDCWSQKPATLCDEYGNHPKPFPPSSPQHLKPYNGHLNSKWTDYYSPKTHWRLQYIEPFRMTWRTRNPASVQWNIRIAKEEAHITIFIKLGFFRHFETVTNIRTWIKSHWYWRML